jgi:hypothetical protein
VCNALSFYFFIDCFYYIILSLFLDYFYCYYYYYYYYYYLKERERAMSTTQLSRDAAVVALPEPILMTDNYSTAPTMLTDTPTINQITNTISLNIKDNEKLELQDESKACSLLVTSTGTVEFYYIKSPHVHFLNGEHQQETSPAKLLLLYNSSKGLWQLNSRDWHGMTLSLNTTQIVLSTSPPQFSFTWNKQICHWQVISAHHQYSLQCYQTDTKKLIAEIPKESDKMIIIGNIQDANTTNPYRQSTQLNEPNSINQWTDDPFTTLVILTGLLIRDHVKLLLKSMGDGPDALHMMVDPSFRPKHHSAPQAMSDGDEEEEDDAASFASYNPSRHYPGHQSLVDDRGAGRWSSTPSFKSIELDPGIWHCWWGYKFWWSWFPWCMPGGCCDRACIKLKGGAIRPKLSATSRHLSKQGLQQQHY